MECRFDAAALRHGEIGALADHLAAQILGGDPNSIIGAVPRRLVRLVRSADIGANAAKEDQINPRFEDGANKIVRRDMFTDAEQSLRLRCELDVFSGAREHAAALGNDRPVEILPA